eukprot:Clim_evm13s151 gene=Clim_evmTU13s151
MSNKYNKLFDDDDDNPFGEPTTAPSGNENLIGDASANNGANDDDDFYKTDYDYAADINTQAQAAEPTIGTTDAAGLLSNQAPLEPMQPMSHEQTGTATEGQSQPRSGSIFSIDYYSQFFDVDTPMVIERSKLAATPWDSSFFERLGKAPDLYGPFWIATTLVFAMGIFANLSEALSAHENWRYDFTKISLGATFVYGYLIIVPAGLWGWLRYNNAPMPILELVCLVGYSLVVYLPISLLCVLNFEWLRWILILAGFLFSGIVQAINLGSELREADMKTLRISQVICLLTALGMSLGFKFYFFAYQKSTTD